MELMMEEKTKKLNKQTRGKMNLLEEVFIERKNKLRGLTKEEMIAEVYRLDIEKVLRMQERKIKNLMQEIKRTRKFLQDRKQFAVVSERAEKGEILNDPIKYGKRVLTEAKHIYFRLIDPSTAVKIRDRNYKIAEGFEKSGDTLVEIADGSEEAEKEREKEQKAVKILRGEDGKSKNNKSKNNKSKNNN